MAVKKAETEIEVPILQQGIARLRIVGTTPLIQNRMAAKARLTLLVGGQKKTKADKASIKHDPYAEFRNAYEPISSGPTAVGLRVTAVKGAMATAALETPGMTKTSAQRLLFMPGELTAVYGTPKLRLDVVRSADINRTPDIRSRPHFERWCAEVEIRHVMPQLPIAAVVALLCNAGALVGVGDFRQEKGRGSFGAFRVLGSDQQDDEWDELVAEHGRAAQEAAFADPQFANEETAELMQAFFTEVKRRAA